MVKLILIEGVNSGFVSTVSEYKANVSSTIIPVNLLIKGMTCYY